MFAHYFALAAAILSMPRAYSVVLERPCSYHTDGAPLGLVYEHYCQALEMERQGASSYLFWSMFAEEEDTPLCDLISEANLRASYTEPQRINPRVTLFRGGLFSDGYFSSKVRRGEVGSKLNTQEWFELNPTFNRFNWHNSPLLSLLRFQTGVGVLSTDELT